ncbi:aldehyde dehydrogenase [Rossellomorea vietnamensis]|uniref:Aldehyde dehydrogenase n=1 Tax=Rossellomorea aquimaris TaxID=189382 RepID=A0A5D4TM71_9BACI|nr:aldehyde dehydrogenase [Rossellomorea aquimaris]TYS76059.1 aldehyde dehydrogenase [Rossellomorea aquimaris]
MSGITIPEKSKEEVTAAVDLQKAYYGSGKTRPLEARKAHLKKLGEVLRENESKILKALHDDLNKSEREAYTTEIGILLEEINFTLKNLDSWAKPKKVKTAVTHFGSKGYRIPEPYGVSLIIAPWNYPIQLAISPLIGALAAGNTAILKPSEITPNTSRVLVELFEDFEKGLIHVLEGGVETNQLLLDQPFDYIFFTGSVPVGKIVMEAASKRLIPVTLELGGKSPCIVHEDADLSLAAKRVAFGKLANSGQTCIAPDYLFVHENVKESFIEEYKKAVHEFYGNEPFQSDQYGKVVNKRHYTRLKSYLSDGEVIYGGGFSDENLQIQPTLLKPRSTEVPVMTEEIFGPIFPVLTYGSLEEVKSFVTSRPKPLALYLFTGSENVERDITENLSFGGGCINDTLMHIVTPHLPFGGVGESGIGSYHGESSFSTFSHYKSILKQTTRFDFSFKYPNSKNGLKILRRLLK